MTIIDTLRNQYQRYQKLNRSIKLFLLLTILHGLSVAVWSLYFNFFILANGFDKEFLGLTNSIPSATIWLLSVPLGFLIDRIGSKRSMIVGQFINLVGLALITQVIDETAILGAMVFHGIGVALNNVAYTPLLAKLTNKDNRTLFFSFNAGISTFAFMAGNLLAGQLPGILQQVSGIVPQTAASYQSVLIISVALSVTRLIPMFLINEPKHVEETEPNQPRRSSRQELIEVLKNPIVWKLVLPNLLVGLGAALMVPYLNIFLVEKFATSDELLGTLFSIVHLVTALGMFVAPRLAKIIGTRIRTVVMAQTLSLLFLLVLGFSPWFGFAIVGFFMRNALMNMVGPLYQSFGMEQIPEKNYGALNSLWIITWEFGWAVGPYLSGLIQQAYGFAPIFIATATLYGIATVMLWVFFRHMEPVPQAQTILQSA